MILGQSQEGVTITVKCHIWLSIFLAIAITKGHNYCIQRERGRQILVGSSEQTESALSFSHIVSFSVPLLISMLVSMKSRGLAKNAAVFPSFV